MSYTADRTGATTDFLYDGDRLVGEYNGATLTRHRLLSVAGAASGTLAYDPLGRLRTYATGGATTAFLYSGDQLVAEYNGTTLLRRYVHGAGVDVPIAWYEGATLAIARRFLTGLIEGCTEILTIAR